MRLAHAGAMPAKDQMRCQCVDYSAFPAPVLVTSACAIGKTPEKGISHLPERGRRLFPRKRRSSQPLSLPVSAGGRLRKVGLSTTAPRGWSNDCESFEPAADACGGIPAPYCGQLRATGFSLFGKAAWYNPRRQADRQRRDPRHRPPRRIDRFRSPLMRT